MSATYYLRVNVRLVSTTPHTAAYTRARQTGNDFRFKPESHTRCTIFSVRVLTRLLRRPKNIKRYTQYIQHLSCEYITQVALRHLVQ